MCTHVKNLLIVLTDNILSLMREAGWWVVAYWLLQGLFNSTANMPPPEREASPDLQLHNLAVEKAGVGEEEAGDLVMVPSGFRACGWSAGKTALSLWLMVGNLEAGARERLMWQHCATWMNNIEISMNLKPSLNLIAQSLSISSGGRGVGGTLIF